MADYQEQLIRENFEFAEAMNRQLSYLVGLTQKTNELDQVAATNPEFRGSQDAGWNTYQTALEVAHELKSLLGTGVSMTRPVLRQVFALYAQLSEAGGFYETLSNMIGIMAGRQYTGWPFQGLVRVRQSPQRVIGPNANAVFRNLALEASRVGLTGLSSLLENTFNDELRNAISHTDYILSDEGIRLRKRNGGYPSIVTYPQFLSAVMRGVTFFDLVQQHWGRIVRGFDPPRTVVGRFSANAPMRWEVRWDPIALSFSISADSTSFARSSEYDRQERINEALSGQCVVLFAAEETEALSRFADELTGKGVTPAVALTSDMDALDTHVASNNLWDSRHPSGKAGALVVSPFGFVHLTAELSADTLLPVVLPIAISTRRTRAVRHQRDYAKRIRDRARGNRPIARRPLP